MKIAVIGSGGREHAICWKLAQSVGAENVFCLPGNGGIENSHPIEVNDFKSIHDFCVKQEIELIFVGPEVPLTKGIVNHFNGTNIKVFGPDQDAAELEASKIKSKLFMNKYGVSTAPFEAFENPKEAQQLIEAKNGNLVIKYDGLAGGKGVYVCSNKEEAQTALVELEEKYGNDFPFLIEDKIIGDEISIIGFTDGQNIQLLQPSQDHKQLLEGDKGPNTGGMGAYCPVPFCDKVLMQKIQEKIIEPTIKGIQAEKLNYKGSIYFGIMISEGEPYLLEYNVRLGDPETEIILPALKSDFLALTLACLDGTLADFKMEFHDGYFVDVVQVSGGYPKNYQKGFPITGLEQVETDTIVFHAGTKKEGGSILTNGGRVLNIVAQGNSLEEAITKVYQECEKVSFENHYYRKDIGQRPNSK